MERKMKTPMRRNKKWTESEARIIINYMLNNPDIEAPTAQIYYRRFLEETNVDSTWELVRWKVRHFKNQYKKALDWKRSNDAGLLEDTFPVGSLDAQKRILQMCPYFDDLHQIYGKRFADEKEYDTLYLGDTITINELDYNGLSSVEKEEYEEQSVASVRNFRLSEEESQDSNNSEKYHVQPVKKANNGNEVKVKLRASRASSARFSTTPRQTDPTDSCKIKTESEKPKRSEVLKLKERELTLQENKFRAVSEWKSKELELKSLEMENSRAVKILHMEKDEKLKILEMEKDEKLKILEIEKDERLKILEIEKDERIKKFEIEMKYRHLE